MSCGKALEIDLPGFLAEPDAPGFASFRGHYPRCPSCSAEVRAWTELHLALLGSAAAGAHPDAELLVRHADQPDRLSAAEQGALAAHLARCPACRDEVAALRGFSPAALTPAGRSGRRHARPGRVLAPLGWLWQPAVAWAAAALLLVPALRGVRAPDTVVDRPPANAPPGRIAPAPAGLAAPAAADDAATRAAAPPAQELFALEAAPRVLALDPDRPARIATSEAAAGLRLRIDLPRAAELGFVEIRVFDAARYRELAERLAPDAGSPALELTVPPGWLAPGSYRIEARPAGSPAVPFALEVIDR
jgi:hypothetical protein